MCGFQYLADGHHVDEAGNLISCTYVDFRDPAERFPITALQKASSKRHAIPGCETIRISKPRRFLGRGEELSHHREDEGEPDASREPDDPSEPSTSPPEPSAPPADEEHYGRNGWIYCAFIESETPDEQAAWRDAMPAGYDAISPIRRPREFARALGAMAAEQIGPLGRTVLLRNTVDGQGFCTAHRHQAIYHGPVAYSEHPYRRLEMASSVLEFALLLVFMKDASYRAQREYRFAVWTVEEPAEDRVDLKVSPALLEAVRRERPEPEASGFVSAEVEESSALREIAGAGSCGLGPRVDTLPSFTPGNTAIKSSRYVIASPSDAGAEATVVPTAAVRALRDAVAAAHAKCRLEAAAAAWYAEPIIRSFCSSFGDEIAHVRVSDENFIVISTAVLPGAVPVQATIAIGPEDTYACKITSGGTHTAHTAPDAQSFEELLKKRLLEVGVRGRATGP